MDLLKRYHFVVSHNCGVSYHVEYTTDDRNDVVLQQKIKDADSNLLRWYIEDIRDGDNTLCNIHQETIALLTSTKGGKHDTVSKNPYKHDSIEDQVNRLRQKFCK